MGKKQLDSIFDIVSDYLGDVYQVDRFIVNNEYELHRDLGVENEHEHELISLSEKNNQIKIEITQKYMRFIPNSQKDKKIIEQSLKSIKPEIESFDCNLSLNDSSSNDISLLISCSKNQSINQNDIPFQSLSDKSKAQEIINTINQLSKKVIKNKDKIDKEINNKFEIRNKLNT